jgi:hypothetical protein
MKYLAYLNILFGDNHVQNSGNCKKGDALRTTLVLKIGCFARDYLQTRYSDMLDISFLFNNNTSKSIKAKIFPFNQK